MTCATLLHQNQNSDHYLPSLKLGSNDLVQKIWKPHKSHPKNYIPHTAWKHKKMSVVFLEAKNLAIQSLTRTLHTPHVQHTDWVQAEEKFQEIINTSSACIEIEFNKSKTWNAHTYPIPNTHPHNTIPPIPNYENEHPFNFLPNIASTWMDPSILQKE